MLQHPHNLQQAPTLDEVASAGRREIDAAIAELERATTNLSQRINASSPTQAPSGQNRPADPRHPPPTAPPMPPAQPMHSAPAPRQPTSTRETSADAVFAERVRQAEREAGEYLDRAKQRADSLVNTMIAAVEQEAGQIREDAEAGIRERWRVVEAEAGRFLDDAKRVADGMVAERQQSIGALSDGIVDRAQSLTQGMEDAARIRRQFDDFVRALSRTAAQVAEHPQGSTEATIARLQDQQQQRGTPRRNSLAA